MAADKEEPEWHVPPRLPPDTAIEALLQHVRIYRPLLALSPQDSITKFERVLQGRVEEFFYSHEYPIASKDVVAMIRGQLLSMASPKPFDPDEDWAKAILSLGPYEVEVVRGVFGELDLLIDKRFGGIRFHGRPFVIPLPPQEQLAEVNDYWLELIARIIRAPESLYHIDPHKLEELVAELFISEGFNVGPLPRGADGGVDLMVHSKGVLKNHLHLVQIKRYARHNKVTVNIARELMGVVEEKKANSGIVLTTSSFTKTALRYEEKIGHRLSLMNGEYVLDWMLKYCRERGIEPRL